MNALASFVYCSDPTILLKFLKNLKPNRPLTCLYNQKGRKAPRGSRKAVNLA